MRTETNRREPPARPPLERLVDSSLRLQGQPDEARLCAALLEEAAQLLGAQRVLLVLPLGKGLRVAGARLPAGESADELLDAVTPWLAEARKRRASRLRHGPEGAEPQHQRSCLVAPMVLDQRVLGVVYADVEGVVGRFDASHRTLLAKLASSAAAALDKLQRLQALQRQADADAAALQQALAQQIATAEILHGISQSPADATPTFDAVAARARVLCGALIGFTTLYDGEFLHMVGFHGASAQAKAVMSASFPLKPGPGSANGRCMRDAAPAQIADVLREPGFELNSAAQAAGYRSVLAVPVLQGGKAIGTLGVMREEAGEFPPQMVAMLQTFADQAVIAIGNAKLFSDTQQALARQTATADMLRIISASPTDVQPVFDAIVGTALSLIDCDSAVVLRRHGDTFATAALQRKGQPLEAVTGIQVPFDPQANFPSRTMFDKRTMHIPDWGAIDLPPHEQKVYDSGGIAASLMLPLVLQHKGECIGALAFARKQAGPFSAEEIALAESFRDQAVIAIQNAQLFNDTQQALERQTATSEVLQVISSSVADAQPVLEKILDSCTHLFDAQSMGVMLIGEDGLLHLSAMRAIPKADAPAGWRTPEDAARGEAFARSTFPMPLAGTGTAEAIASGHVLNFPDVLNGADVPRGVNAPAKLTGLNYSQMMAPLLQGGRGIGAISLQRPALGGFTAQEQELLPASPTRR